MTGLAWLVPVLPLAAYVLLLLGGRRLAESAVTSIAVLAVAASFVISLAIMIQVAVSGPQPAVTFPWLALGGATISFGFEVTSLNAMMLVMVSFVSALVLLFSRGYMHGDARFGRFYQYLSLFVFAMLGLVITSNLLEFYIFWELVGVCSYLLVGFWYFKPEAAAAAKKAFIVTRIGDVGLFVGMILLYLGFHTMNFDTIFYGQAVSSPYTMAHGAPALLFAGHALTGPGIHALPYGLAPAAFVTLTALLVFFGAVGKSAQFPLHVWLPDAMEGPTPVSALIHAATMVAAGVYLVARMFPLFQASATASDVVAAVGGFTAILAALIGLTQRDIKRVIAYSTVSQLGYMMLALGVGAYVSGIFHLMTHAFFKALLFLTAGSVIHAVETQDLFEMGGLRKLMPLTNAAFLAGALALSGIPPFAGFWSKDEILSAAFSSGNYVLYAVGLIAAFCTAFYIFRVYFLTFGGEYKGDRHPHEGGLAMTVPLATLAVMALVAGFFNSPWAPWIARFLQDRGPVGYDPAVNWGLMVVSAAVGLAGIGLAYYAYGAPGRAQRMAQRSGFLYTLSFNKFYFDELYDRVVTRPVRAVAEALEFVDRWIVDGLVRLVSRGVFAGGAGLRYGNTGQIQTYGLVTLFGVAILLIIAAGIGGVL